MAGSRYGIVYFDENIPLCVQASIALVPPVHVRRGMPKTRCQSCKTEVWSDRSLVACSECVVVALNQRHEPTAATLRQALSSALWQCCDDILSSVASQLPVPSWADIVAHPHVLEQPHHALAGSHDTLVLHNACACLDIDAVRVVLQRWPESVNVKNQVESSMSMWIEMGSSCMDRDGILMHRCFRH